MISRRCFCASAFIAFPALAAEREASPEKMGYEQTALGREETQKAIERTNLILHGRFPFRLLPGWTTTPPSDPHGIPVWLIQSAGNPRSALMEVPRSSCRCIVIRIADMRAWLARHQTVAGQTGLGFDVANIMSFMLLHEVGHISAGHPGQLEAASDTEVVAPTSRLTAQQCRELEADTFASTVLKRAIRSVGSSGWIEANWVAIELSKLSFNLFGKRLLEKFPANALGAASVFGDRAYSHPNFDLRIYALNADISDDVTSKQLLEEFLQNRLRIGRPDLSCASS